MKYTLHIWVNISSKGRIEVFHLMNISCQILYWLVKFAKNLLLLSCYITIFFYFYIFMLCDCILCLLLPLLLPFVLLCICVWMNVLWPVGINISRLTCFIIQIHLSTISAPFFILFFCFLVFISLCMCKSMCVCVCVCFDAPKNGSKSTYTQRQYEKKTRHRRKNVIHSSVHSLLVLFSS